MTCVHSCHLYPNHPLRRCGAVSIINAFLCCRLTFSLSRLHFHIIHAYIRYKMYHVMHHMIHATPPLTPSPHVHMYVKLQGGEQAQPLLLHDHPPVHDVHDIHKVWYITCAWCLLHDTPYLSSPNSHEPAQRNRCTVYIISAVVFLTRVEVTTTMYVYIYIYMILLSLKLHECSRL